MSDCQHCEAAGRSGSTRPFVPPDGTVNDLTFECGCGGMWFQMNPYYHLWQRAKSKEELAGVRDEILAAARGELADWY